MKRKNPKKSRFKKAYFFWTTSWYAELDIAIFTF
jgi:hypothetical protein